MIKVLVADDEEIVRTSLVDMIPWQELGMVLVGSVRNGVEALDIVSDDPPDIVITDIRMPMMDGLELIGRIKVLSPDTEIIILSGFGEFSYAQKAMSYGVKHYLLKPTRKEDLIELLRRISYERTDNGALRYSYQLERLMLLDALSDPSTIGHSLKLLGINPASGAAIQEGRGGEEPFFRPVMAGGTVYSFVPDGAPDAPRLEDAIEHVHQRGLSSAIFADQAMDLAGFHREIYAIYRLNAGKGLVDVGHFDCVLIHIRDLLQMKVRFDIRFKSKVRPPRPRCESAAGEMGGRWRANGLYATTGGNSASLIY